jgi:hypothetical protein
MESKLNLWKCLIAGRGISEFFERDIVEFILYNGKSGSESIKYNVSDDTYSFVLKVINDTKVYSSFYKVQK